MQSFEWSLLPLSLDAVSFLSPMNSPYPSNSKTGRTILQTHDLEHITSRESRIRPSSPTSTGFTDRNRDGQVGRGVHNGFSEKCATQRAKAIKSPHVDGVQSVVYSLGHLAIGTIQNRLGFTAA